MYNCKLTTVALAILLSGGAISAESWHTGKKESSGMKGSSGFERSSRSEQPRKHVSKPSRERTPEIHYKTGKTAKAARPAVKQGVKSQHTKTYVKKAAKQVKRKPAWIPPKRKPLPYYHRPGYTIRTIPKVAISVSLGGLLFYYTDGIYYRHHNSGYMVTLPPIGLLVPVLPLGYVPFNVYGSRYYYYADVYYVWDIHHRAYRVVEAPEVKSYQPGTIVDTLPDGAYTVTIDGVQYYRYDGVYFMQSIQGERIVYIVVTP